MNQKRYFIYATKKLGLFIATLCLPFCLLAQVKYVDFKPLSVDQGLPGNAISSILNDHEGFMWFATEDGLVRYDGYNIKIFVGDPEDSTKLSASFIYHLFEDRLGNLWVMCADQRNLYLHKYDRNLEQFQLIKTKLQVCVSPNLAPIMIADNNNHIWIRTCTGLQKIYKERTDPIGFRIEEVTEMPSKVVKTLFIDKGENLWIGTGNGLYKKEKNTMQFDSIPLVIPQRHNITGINETTEGKLVIATWGAGVIIYNPKSKKSIQYFNQSNIVKETSDHINRMVKDRNGYFWLHTYNVKSQRIGIYRFDIQNKQFRAFSHKSKESGSLHDIFGLNSGLGRLQVDNKGNVWVFTKTTIECYDTEIESFYEIKSRTPNNYENFLSFHEDKNGTYWISYNNQGVISYSPVAQKIVNIPSIPNDPYSISHGIVVNVIEDEEGNIWTGSYGGIDKLELDKNHRIQSVTPYKHDPNNPNSLESNNTFVIEEDKDGFIWTHLMKGELNRLNPKTGKVTRNLPDPSKNNGLKPKLRYDLVASDKAGIWVGSVNEGLYYLNYETGKLTNYTHDPKNSNSISSNNCVPQQLDSEGRLWLKTTNGVNVFYPEEERFESFFRDQNFNATKLHYQESDSILWVANDKYSNHHGIYQYNLKTDSIRKYKTTDYLLTNNLSEIITDDKGRLWISSVVGLICLNPQTDSITTFGLEDGLPTLQFAYGPRFKRKNGELMFGMLGAGGGVVIFHPDSLLKPDPIAPNIAITHFKLFNEPILIGQKNGILTKAINQTDTIVLRHNQNNIEFTYAGLHFAAPSYNQYKYKMTKVDPKWKEVGNQRVASYPSLSPGEYTFEVKAANKDGVWSKESKQIHITILPPWWQTNLAYVCYFILFGFLVWQFIRWRTAAQRKKLAETEKVNTRLRQVDNLKDQFLANTSHELRTPLHGIIGIAEAVFEKAQEDDDKENLGMIIASGKRLSSLVSDLLDFSKVKNHDLELSQKPVDLRAVGDVVLQACYALVGTKPIALHNEIPVDLSPVYADENRLQQIFYNLVGNAIKFTDSGRIAVGIVDVVETRHASSLQKSNQITIFVKDTGIGIPKEKQQTIFQAFEQADGTTEREFGGTGLGLSITRQLVELHGGKIWVESKEDEGSTFFFTLPVADEENMTKISEPSVIEPVSSSLFAGLGTAKSSLRPLQRGSLGSDTPFKRGNLNTVTPFEGGRGMNETVRILLVDDEPINHQVIKNYFRGDEIYLQSVMSGHEALEVIQKEPKFDLVLLDIMMPRMNGYEVCQEIRKQYLPSEIPVIMLTAKSQIADLIQGLETGANDYITKPFSKDEFLARIKTHLNLHRIHSATNKFVPSDFLKTIDRKSITEVRLGDQKEQNITVFFSDIRSYTSLSEGMTPDENFKFVNAYAGRMGPIIRENHGFVNQYLGDGIMALFQQSPTDALKAAIEMQLELQNYNIQRVEQGRQPIRVGMGMHTGSLIMGIIGDELRNDPATISDTVNTAARMEGLTKHFGAQILISETVYERLESDVETLKFNVSTSSGISLLTSPCATSVSSKSKEKSSR